MITLFVALYSLLCLCTAGNTSDIKELHVKTVKRGENVTMECNFNIKNKDNLFWYRQSFGKFPQFLAKSYSDTLGYKFDTRFKDSRFSITVNAHKFDLNINGVRENDRGDYFCVELEGSLLKFTSGTRLQFEEMKPSRRPGTVNKNTDSVTLQGSDSSDGKGKEMKLCPTPGTVNKNTDSTPQGSNSSNGEGNVYWIIALTTSITISLILIAVLIGILFKNQRKGASSRNHQIPTNQADDEDALNYAAVSFAKKPSSSRTSRDKSHEDVYAQVKIK